jgi:8-oxo-dGTP pyrophosphatase MutT (NUDIX family)
MVSIMLKPFIVKERRTLLETPIFKLREQKAEHPRTGRLGTFYVLENPHWVNVVPVTTDGKLVLVRQYRQGLGDFEVELPAGLVEAGESPLEAGPRELTEETGYVPQRVRLIGQVRPNPAYQENLCYTVLAEGCRLEKGTDFDEDEDIEIQLVDPTDLPKLMAEGLFGSACGMAAIFFWLREQGKLTL